MDQKLFGWINSLAGKNQTIDQVMVFASTKFRYLFASVLLMIMIGSRSGKKLTYQTVLSLVISSSAKALINKIKFRPRPFVTRDANVLLASKLDTTYLSKHSLLSFAVSTMVYMYDRGIGKIMLAMSSLTAISRIWVGAHYPFDVVRSSIIGALISILVKKCTFISWREG
ncbi:phosphatase PAP2 family protein [Metabacillus endolithicus]|uniref:Phosphatase PAP2 family protein n=1 Tax=Metabacillus endolithicus TaxID=1535204 RepID=A0ABW5BV44_9BACI|nr:phosphatase PAP2 family protein [Metabacillus endolithicus]UPG63367.1 phosphatase PAP2 family protein [Metabacillus endolithicus]